MSLQGKTLTLARRTGEEIKYLRENLEQTVIENAIARIEPYLSKIEYLVTTPTINLNKVAKGIQVTLSTSASSLQVNDPKPITFFVMSIPELNIVGKPYTASNNSVNITFTVPTTFTNDSITVSLYAVDSENNKSETNTKTISVVEVGVDAPIITSPSENEEITIHNGFTMSTGPFEGYGDTHKQSSWKVSTDSQGANIILNDTNSSDLLEHTFESYQTSGKLLGGSEYYCHAQHIGTNYGVSLWSRPRKFRIKDGIYTQNGRFIYRHSSNRGSVIEYTFNGEKRKLFVYDEFAPSLTYLSSSTYDNEHKLKTDSTVAGIRIFKFKTSIDEVCPEDNFIMGTTETSSSNNGSDDKLYSKLSSSYSLNTDVVQYSRIMCNYLLSKNTDSPLISYARDITNIPYIDNLDIPTVYEQLVILTELDTLLNLGLTHFDRNVFATCNIYLSSYYYLYVVDFSSKSQSYFLVSSNKISNVTSNTFQAFLVRDITDFTTEQESGEEHDIVTY